MPEPDHPRPTADGGGLYLHVKPSGAKSWVFLYENAGKRHEIGLGPLHTVSLAEARQKALECRELLLDGRDPLAHKRNRDAIDRDPDQIEPKLLVLARIRELPSILCGIYFLFWKGQLQRIGQTTNMLSRMETHQGEKISFDEVRVLRCQPVDLDRLEALYIRKYDPPDNRELTRSARNARASRSGSN
jgi:hypothetical protein